MMRHALAPWFVVASLVGALLPTSALADPPRRQAATTTYRGNVNRWHDAAQVPRPRYTEDGRLILRVFSVNGLGSAEVTPATPEGGFDEAACAEVSRVLGDSRARSTGAIDRRLIEVVYAVARHFRAGQITVISGYRAQRQPSNHRLGRAVDILVPGVADSDVAAYARTLGMLGVGYYPIGGFTHIDVRTRSYYWVDRSAPGSPARSRRSRRRGRSRAFAEVHGTEARRADEEARARGVFPFGGTRGASTPNNGTAAASGVAETAAGGDGAD
jgi:uncharacterized protein YcbK (DUF882 family)